MILGGVLRQFGGDVFGRRLQRPQDFITALDRLFGDLAAEGVAPGAFRAALEARSDRDGFERERDGELQLIYEEYLKRLAGKAGSDGKGVRDGRDGLLDSALAIATDPAGLAERLGGRRELRIFGLQDLRGGWRRLLGALAGSGALDRIAIYTAEPLELGIETAPRVTRLDEPDTIATRLFGVSARPHPESSEGPPQNSSGKAGEILRDDSGSVELHRRWGASGLRGPGEAVDLITAPDVERELEDVARRIRTLALAGTPLHRIAVITRQARPYVDLALAALDRFGVPGTARRRIGWSEIPVIRAVRALLAAAAEGWTRHGLTELAEQPYFARWQGHELDVRLVSYAGYRRRLRGLKAWK
ncbi:MAG TPA: hypothetical protein VFJ81_02585, partial [Gemmatimonadales bacterium]|nr:hypothetical protein [Gemmatimonadales bacterium]